jgi:hypothetical protein
MMAESHARFTRRLTESDETLGSVIVDGAEAVLPAAPFNLVAGGRVLKCAVADVGCRCPEADGPHHHKVLSAEGLAAVIDVRKGNLVVLRRDEGQVAVEETAFAFR